MDHSSYRENLAEVVSQAAVHLHNSMGPVGTALFDQNGSLVIDNNAFHYAKESILSGLAADCLCDPSVERVQRHVLDGVTAFTAALDHQHVFVVVGNGLEDTTVNHFLSSLRRLLPKAPTDD
jgi:hypothetical protein